MISPDEQAAPEPARLARTGRAADFRSLADSFATTSEGRPAGDDEPASVAATVVLLRERHGGPEVLMMERPARGSFAGAWVFPGGKLDPEDAAHRDEPEEDVARRAGSRETHEEVGLEVEPREFVTMSRWVPPSGTTPRIRTWFFAARAPQAQLRPSPDEAVWADWMRPADVLERHGRGEITLYPPTWVTLFHLIGQHDVEGLLGRVRLSGVEYFESAALRAPSGPVMLWHGDAEYDGPGRGIAAERHRLEVGALPWRYTRSFEAH